MRLRAELGPVVAVGPAPPVHAGDGGVDPHGAALGLLALGNKAAISSWESSLLLHLLRGPLPLRILFLLLLLLP